MTGAEQRAWAEREATAYGYSLAAAEGEAAQPSPAPYADRGLHELVALLHSAAVISRDPEAVELRGRR